VPKGSQIQKIVAIDSSVSRRILPIVFPARIDLHSERGPGRGIESVDGRRFLNLQPNPGGLKPVVDRRHNDASEREHVLVAIREAFDAASRQIEDIARDMRGQVKEHTAESHGRVAKLLAADECGFIETADGREIYFHRNAVLDGAYR
jgi:hypothetical protein